VDNVVVDFLLNIELHNNSSYQQQIREKLVHLIKQDAFDNKPLPSSRKMAELIGVSRNTIILVYESLVDEGYLIAHKRRGFFVHPDVPLEPALKAEDLTPLSHSKQPNWAKRLQKKPSEFSSLNKNNDWTTFAYPFIYGQIDPKEFPLYQWRECSRIVESRGKIHEWVKGFIDVDDAELVTQIRQKILSKRGIVAQDDEILITLGTQNSLFLLSHLLASDSITFGVEEPGHADLRHIISLCNGRLKALDIDNEGVQLGKQLTGCDYVCVTPSHQYPTTVTMGVERRKALLQQAVKDSFVVIEDDYESEVNFIEKPLPALKSFDQDGRVIYVGSLSKSLSPGIRIGYLVADKKLIQELRKLRHLHYRHPPANNQRIAALFISQGFYDSHVRRMRRIYEDKWLLMKQGIELYFKGCVLYSTPGSFCFWIALPEGITSYSLIKIAAEQSILVESGDSLFMKENVPHNYIRLGFSAIHRDKILPGLSLLGQMIDELQSPTQS
jgi:GntR family transcriptional regulator/MocR family aminotransferase